MGEVNNLPVPKSTKSALVLQFINGLILLILGILAAVYYNDGSGEGSPYFIGGIITGVLMMLLSAINYLDCNSSTQQKLCTLRCGICLSLGVFITSLISTIVVCIVGLHIRDCTVYSYGPVCVWNKLIQIRITTIVMFIFLLGSVILNGLCAALLLIYYRRLSRSTLTGGQTEEGVTPGVIIHPGVSACGDENNPNNPDKPADLSATIQPGVSGSYRDTTLSYPSHTVGGQGYYVPGAEQPFLPQNNESMSQLEEQNRLLREHIALQQQVIQLQQQQQQQQSTVGPVIGQPPLPPSYESIIDNQTQVQTLQEQNRHLQDLYHHQQQQLPEKGPLGQSETPSAPPMFPPPSEDSI